jgi:undecaprenyl diphosphate synthase
LSIVIERVDTVLWKKIVLPRLSWKSPGIRKSQREGAALSIDAGGRLPRHVGIIMDGNGRWAEARGLPRSAGHRQGVQALREIVRVSGKLGISVLTAYCFSTENWQRPQEEVDFLMQLLLEVLSDELESLHEEGVRIVPIGRLEDLPKAVRKQVEQAAKLTAHNQLIKLNMAISYGGRLEIITAIQRLLDAAKTDNSLVLDEATLAQYLYTVGDPDLDLIIRTGGEQRLSNFLLWQGAYAELYFSDIMWPDFTVEDFMEAIRDYQRRERRFGRIPGK